MARTDRLFRLLAALRRLPAPVTAARLAEETGVSARTLYRDIETLRAGGALIDGAAGFGYTLTEDPALPPQNFTREEIEALVLGLSEAAVRGDPALSRAAETALSKIVATLPDRLQQQVQHAVVQVRRYETPTPATADFSIIRQACWEESALDITYADAEGRETRRRVWPLSMVYLEQSVIVLAWCCLRQDFRKFMVARILDVAPTNESFRPRRAALLRTYIAQMQAAR